MRRLILLLAFATSAAATQTCPEMRPDLNVFINFRGPYTGCDLFEPSCGNGEPITFTAANFGYDLACAAHEFTWNFGDGNIAAGPQVTHSYAESGTYAVTVLIRNGTQTVLLRRLLDITWLGPWPGFYAFSTRVRGAFVFSIAYAIGSGDWIWDFGDGTIERGPERKREHVYTKPGRYTVRLSSAGGSGTYEESVHVQPPPEPKRRRSARH